MVTVERIREAFDYDAISGIFRWKLPTNTRIKIGSIAGNSGTGGYWLVGIDGQKYMAGRLAWLYVYGVWPTHQIDHINRNKHDNSILNLRDVTDAVNKLNMDRSCVVRDIRGRFALTLTSSHEVHA